jgi:hypothetical protein
MNDKPTPANHHYYIFQAVDLAKFFANGADHTKDFVCLVHADGAPLF